MNEIKNAAISARLLAFIQNGSTIEEAFNYVLGPGYYGCMVEELYSDLNKIQGDTK
ncbi:MAG: hypothetical protein ACYC4K_08675 [Thiobacillus sp.]